MPDVRVHLSAYVLELVQISDWDAAVGDGDTPDFTKRVGVEKTQLLRAVAENESLSISSQAPTLARISQCSTRRETREIVDKRNIRSPRQLYKLAVPLRQSFGKIGTIEMLLLHNLARFELDFSQG